jgi:ATP-dependent exoDNAse (exonuclease V) alpha subunit
MSDNLNEKQRLAYNKIINNENICIVGQGGTGKSYLCELIKDSKTLFLSPSGMAAMNIGPHARTIHSTLMLGSESLKAWDWEKVKDSIEKNKSKVKEFFDNYERIVLDEASMVISGLFTTFIQTFYLIYDTDSSVLFNNKQIVIILDPLQLPAVKSDEDCYIDSKNPKRRKQLSKSDLIIHHPVFKNLFSLDRGNIIHFTENMRCIDEEWRKVLHHCRTGFNLCNIDEKEKILKLLNERVFPRSKIRINAELYNKNHTSLKTSLTHNYIEEINEKHMEKLETQKYSIKRIPIDIEQFKNDLISMGYSSNDARKTYNDALNYMDNLGGYHSIKVKEGKNWIWMTEFTISVGQKVMYRRNNNNTMIRNGSLGIITNINYSEEDDLVTRITIKFEGINGPCEINTIQYEHPDWSNLTVTAFPIISAFAITTHKLQGQTIEDPLFIHYSNDIIPYYKKQEHLLYTAISRCKVKENVYIISDNEITSDHFPVNQYMFDWWRKINDDQPIIV